MDYLVVEDDPLLAGLLAQTLPGDVCHVGTLAEARAQLGQARVSPALVVDVALPDGTGLDLLEEVRRHGSWDPALVITGAASEGLATAAQRLGSFFARKPVDRESIEAFSAYVQGASRSRVIGCLSARVGALADARGLSVREREVLKIAATGVARVELSSRLGIAETTLKTFVRRIVRKTGHFTLADVVAMIHRDVFEYGEAPRVGPCPDISSRCDGSRLAAHSSLSCTMSRAKNSAGEAVVHDLNGIIMSLSLLRPGVAAAVDDTDSDDVIEIYDEAINRLVAVARRVGQTARSGPSPHDTDT